MTPEIPEKSEQVGRADKLILEGCDCSVELGLRMWDLQHQRQSLKQKKTGVESS